MSIVIAIDAGTTGVRSLALNPAGQTVASAYREFPQYFPHPGWVEHDPIEIWTAVLDTLAEVKAETDADVAAIGITNQRETVLAWDRRDGRPRHRAIVWQDRRTADHCQELSIAGHLPLIRKKTGLVLDPYFSATKMAWMLNHGGVANDEHLAFGTIDAWILWNLTAGEVFATDVTNASRTLLFDINTLAWSDELLKLFECPASALPEVRPSSSRFGLTVATTALGPGIPISGIAGDQQAALFGQACTQPGMTKNTYGTGSFVLMNVGEDCPEPVDGLLTTVAWSIERPDKTLLTHYALEGSIFVTGAAVQWLRDGLQVINQAAEVEALALQCEDSAGVVVVPAFTGLGSPWWDPYARGTILGLTRGVGRAQIARATVESMVYHTRDVVEAMAKAAKRPIGILRVDGGASAMNLLIQLQADQLGVPVTRATHQETTARGAAYLAGLAEGVWGSLEEIEAHWSADLEAQPSIEAGVADEQYRQWLRAIERSRDWDHPG